MSSGSMRPGSIPQAVGTRLRVGWFPYLNCYPLQWGMRGTPSSVEGAQVLATPSLLATELTAGTIDVAPISLVEYLRHSSDLLMLRDVAIGSDGPVLSCYLFSRYELADLHGRRVALCSTSRTTVILAQLLLDDRLGIRPQYVDTGPELESMLSQADAAVLIGDAALAAGQAVPAGIHAYDLGGMWRDWAGLPMVFAVWAVGREVARNSPGAVAAFHRDLTAGLEKARRAPRTVVENCAQDRGWPQQVLAEYFDTLDFRFGERQLAGVEHFSRLAVARGHVAPTPVLEFFDLAATAGSGRQRELLVDSDVA